jgi:TfoX/Sxy family transcriptional regulator of competence genes
VPPLRYLYDPRPPYEAARRYGLVVPTKVPKPGPEHVARFRQLAGRVPEATTRQMFGNPCAFVNGQLCFGLLGDGLFLRLAQGDRHSLLQQGAEPLEPMPDRPMKEYVVLPPAMVDDDAAIGAWMERSVAYVRSLPPKAPKARKAAR